MKQAVIFFCILSLLAVKPLNAQEIEKNQPVAEEVSETEKSSPTPVTEQDEEEDTDEDETNENENDTETNYEESDIEPEPSSTTNQTSSTENQLAENVIQENTTATTSGTNSEPSAQMTDDTSSSTPSSDINQNASDFSENASLSTTNNQASIENTAESTASSGDNSINASDEAHLETGSASATTTQTTETNTTLYGNNFHYGVENVVDPTTNLDFSGVERDCTGSLYTTTDTEKITIDNKVEITNSVNTAVNTGNNYSSGDTHYLVTGDAAAEAQIANIANTSLIGNCWLFEAITIFSPYSKSIILPNAEQFITPQSYVSDQQANPVVSINQEASVLDTVDQQATTGGNVAEGTSEVTTGTALNTSEVITNANTALIGNSWMLVKIINPHYWSGSFDNGQQPIYRDSSAAYYWLSPSSSYPQMFTHNQLTASASPTIEINNQASITNDVQLAAHTGNNTALGRRTSILHTGNAKTEAEIFNLLNTTVVGNNWYFVLLNLFEEFSGNIGFARPDLEIRSGNQAKVYPGSSIQFNLLIFNMGQSSAKDIVITQQQPVWSPSQIGNQASWTLSTLLANASSSIPIFFQVPAELKPGIYSITYTINNAFSEHSLTNNSTTFTFEVEALPQITQQQPELLVQPFRRQTPIRRQVARHRANTNTIGQQSNNASQVLGTENISEESPALSVTLPSIFSRPFCQKNWEVCSAVGLLASIAPVRALEKKRTASTKKGRILYLLNNRLPKVRK